MNAEQMKEKYAMLYDYMATSQKPNYMKAFGHVMNEMMDWMIANKPDLAQEWIEKLETVKWKNYLTKKEAERIVSEMEPKSPWSFEQWRQTMEQYNFDTEKERSYNPCALFVTMSMIYSDSIDTINRYIGEGDVFEMIHDLALDKLQDKDGKFSIRHYFGL